MFIPVTWTQVIPPHLQKKTWKNAPRDRVHAHCRQHVYLNSRTFVSIQHQKDISGKCEHFNRCSQGLFKGSGLVLKVEFGFGLRLRMWKGAIRGLVVGVRVVIRGLLKGSGQRYKYKGECVCVFLGSPNKIKVYSFMFPTFSLNPDTAASRTTSPIFRSPSANQFPPQSPLSPAPAHAG